MQDIRIVFFGTPEFACRILKTLIEEHYNVVAVVAQPDKPVGRKHILEPVPVKKLAHEFGIAVLQPDRLKDHVEEIAAVQPDLIVTCAYGQIVPQAVLDLPRLGCLNIHPSLLPKYRGGAPMHHAVWNGDEKTGVCLMEMTKGLDSGRVYARCELPIGQDETTGELSERLCDASCALLKEALPEYLAGRLPGEEQDESNVVLARTISSEEECVSFQKENCRELYNHIRALIDWPIPYAMIDGKRMKIFKARMKIGEQTAEPGTVLGFRDHAMHVSARGGEILIYELQPEGKKRMDADAFANGAGKSLVGRRFE